MTPEDIAQDLSRLASADDFSARSAELTDEWSAAGAGVQSVEPILRFMEDHPAIDFGTPGPLVHFVEVFFGHDYEQRLVESIQRTPTPHTLWMLNRVINGTRVAEARHGYIQLMECARSNPLAAEDGREAAERFLARLH
jgi:hypothetical protein